MDNRHAQAHFVPAFSTWLDVANMRLIKRIEKSFEVDQCLASQVREDDLSLIIFPQANVVCSTSAADITSVFSHVSSVLN